MKINRRKVIKNAILIIFSLIVILLLILGMLKSNFTNIKKYDKSYGNPNTPNSLQKTFFDNQSISTQVVIEQDGVANLGDFVFSLSPKKKLIANISFTYKPNKNSNAWFESDAKIRDEIVKKGTILRDATIDIMLLNQSAEIENEEMREAIREGLNKNLHNGEADKIYFNKFIIQ